MVQYILTPWRDRRELLKVRQQFYPAAPLPVAPAFSAPAPAPAATATATALARASALALPTAPSTRGAPAPAPGSATGAPPSQHHQHRTGTTSAISGSSYSSVDNDGLLAAQHHAVARVSMWMQRGNCPHMVESTALLTAAILSDGESKGSAGTYAVRAAYAAAFSRFVTGLLDGHQDKQRKLSMYSVAKTIGLPATFVELRHQATHETLPSLAKLRSAARKALVWIWEYYWQHLGPDEEESVEDVVPERKVGVATAAAGRAVVIAFLEERDEARRAEMKNWIDGLDKSRLLTTLDKIAEAPPSNAIKLAALRLSKGILLKGKGIEGVGPEYERDRGRKVDEIKKKIAQAKEALAAETQDVVEDSADDLEIEEAQESGGTGWAKFVGTWKPRPIGVA
ncbi:Las1-like-domain-containing protein [Colletotrichum navitas]|uniref:Las1-like-domain-containing protein n=1 Tax=Colletotrichum navitas TaxID=681940 RepID=A0AAD8Q2T5_9PEZI|nr:Las1-like-domain-containing protein [Colletotrichum navitas]KAK1594856.1 Las1-like-domain-containing protein [Colletotrichum navitas]